MGRSQAAVALAWLSAQLDLLEQMEDGPEKTEAILELAQLPRLAETFTRIRRDEVLRLRQAEGRSLGKTALAVGISKARADQIERAQKAEEARNGESHDRVR